MTWPLHRFEGQRGQLCATLTNGCTLRAPELSHEAGFVTVSEKNAEICWASRMVSMNTVFASDKMRCSAPTDPANLTALLCSDVMGVFASDRSKASLPTPCSEERRPSKWSMRAVHWPL